MEIKLNEDEIFSAIALYVKNQKGVKLKGSSVIKVSTKNGLIFEATITI